MKGNVEFKCRAVIIGRHVWMGRRCNRPVVKNGLCKLHLRVKQRQDEREAQYAAHLKEILP